MKGMHNKIMFIEFQLTYYIINEHFTAVHFWLEVDRTDFIVLNYHPVHN